MDEIQVKIQSEYASINPCLDKYNKVTSTNIDLMFEPVIDAIGNAKYYSNVTQILLWVPLIPVAMIAVWVLLV